MASPVVTKAKKVLSETRLFNAGDKGGEGGPGKPYRNPHVIEARKVLDEMVNVKKAVTSHEESQDVSKLKHIRDLLDQMIKREEGQEHKAQKAAFDEDLVARFLAKQALSFFLGDGR